MMTFRTEKVDGKKGAVEEASCARERSDSTSPERPTSLYSELYGEVVALSGKRAKQIWGKHNAGRYMTPPYHRRTGACCASSIEQPVDLSALGPICTHEVVLVGRW